MSFLSFKPQKNHAKKKPPVLNVTLVCEMPPPKMTPILLEWEWLGGWLVTLYSPESLAVYHPKREKVMFQALLFSG